jgi:hypothetical protein
METCAHKARGPARALVCVQGAPTCAGAQVQGGTRVGGNTSCSRASRGGGVRDPRGVARARPTLPCPAAAGGAALRCAASMLRGASGAQGLTTARGSRGGPRILPSPWSAAPCPHSTRGCEGPVRREGLGAGVAAWGLSVSQAGGLEESDVRVWVLVCQGVRTKQRALRIKLYC